jgi:hypothetical protein
MQSRMISLGQDVEILQTKGLKWQLSAEERIESLRIHLKKLVSDLKVLTKSQNEKIQGLARVKNNESKENIIPLVEM